MQKAYSYFITKPDHISCIEPSVGILNMFIKDRQFAQTKISFYPLYDTIKAIAQTYANLNRFKFVGKSKSGLGTSEYQLGFNIPRGSVTVSAGGQQLRENIDYEINYDLGSLKVINQAIINAGIPVNIQYENNATYGLQNRSYLHCGWIILPARNLPWRNDGKIKRKALFIKQNYGDDPIRNTMYGVDFDYQNDIPRLSRWLDKLPSILQKQCQA